MSAFAKDLLECLGLHGAPVAPARKSSVLSRLKTDLNRLFNAPGLISTLDVKMPPHVARSVLNYGVGNIAGNTISNLDPKILERRIYLAILYFEPRIVRQSLRVTWVKCVSASIPTLQFEIEGLVRDVSKAYAFKLQSVWNAESGEAYISLPSALTVHG